LELNRFVCIVTINKETHRWTGAAGPFKQGPSHWCSMRFYDERAVSDRDWGLWRGSRWLGQRFSQTGGHSTIGSNSLSAKFSGAETHSRRGLESD